MVTTRRFMRPLRDSATETASSQTVPVSRKHFSYYTTFSRSFGISCGVDAITGYPPNSMNIWLLPQNGRLGRVMVCRLPYHEGAQVLAHTVPGGGSVLGLW